MKRLIQPQIEQDLEKKMVFLSGPRQAGKTTLAKKLAEKWPHYEYLNYDSEKDRQIFLKERWSRSKDLIIFDEIHKYKNWKNKIKGIYDTQGNRPRLLITGSARLNLYKKTGDSLAGRYFHHRLYPLSYKEIILQMGKEADVITPMLTLGSFPEPFLSQSEIEAQRWRKDYLSLVLVQDVAQLADIKDLSSLQLLVDLLRNRVGSPISFNALARDLEISPNTVKRYVEILEWLYLIFRVTPYHRNIARAILKEPKIYFFDVGSVRGNEGLRFENLVALHLIKHLHFLEDTQGLETRLHYVRDKSGREVDFLCRVEGQENFLVEAKTSDTKPTSSLSYFQRQTGFKTYQVFLYGEKALQDGCIHSLPAPLFLETLTI